MVTSVQDNAGSHCSRHYGDEHVLKSKTIMTTLLIGRTVEAIDPSGLNITVRSTVCSEKLPLQVVIPAVMEGIKVRDRVNLELDMEGRVLKIRKLAPILREAFK
jgi:hypothetical protein